MSSLDRKWFAVIGFTGAGKTTYIQALGHAAETEGSEYKIVQGVEYIRSLNGGVSSKGRVAPTQKRTGEEVAFKGKNVADCEFGFRDYAGEELVDTNGYLTRLSAGNFSNKVGALILINPFVPNPEDVEDRYRASKYQPIIDYLADNSNIRKVLLVRTASDYYRKMNKDQQERFDSFLEELKKRFEKANKEKSTLKFETGDHSISCQGENDASQLFRPFDDLIQKIDCVSLVNKEDKCEQDAEKPPCDGQKYERKWSWFVALAVLCVLGVFTSLLWTGQGGVNRRVPIETVGQGECGKNDGVHTESDGQVVETAVPKRLCAQCQSELDAVDEGPLCEECQRKQEDERRKKDEEERRQKIINECREELKECPNAIDRIKCLDRVSDQIPADYHDFVLVAEGVSEYVSKEYRGILGRMRDCCRSLEEVVRDFGKIEGTVSYDKANVDGLFSLFVELSATLCKTRNDTLKQSDWHRFIEESFKEKQLGNRCAESYLQKYEISDVSIKVENNPYRWITVALSSFQYSGEGGKYEIREVEKKKDVINGKKSCDWTSIWTGKAGCQGNPWRCCGMKFRFKGNNAGPGQAFYSVAKAFNDEVTSYEADGLGRIEGDLEFGGDEKKGAVKLRYRITFRRLNPEVKSPFSVEGVVK